MKRGNKKKKNLKRLRIGLLFLIVIFFLVIVTNSLLDNRWEDDGRLKGELASLIGSPANLVAYFPFEINANDLTGNGNDMVLHGASLVSGSDCHSGNCYNFDGNNDYLTISSPTFSDQEDLTIMAWIKADSLRDKNVIVNKKYVYRIGLDDSGKIILAGGDGTGNDWYSFWGFMYTTFKGGSISTGSFHHVAIVFNDVGAKGYINGNFAGDYEWDDDTELSFNSNPIEVGYAASEGVYPFDGKMDEIKIFQSALSASSIRAEMNKVYEEEEPPEECVNECFSIGIKTCDGNGFKTCGDYDSDSCLEWNLVTNCVSGKICEAGVCVDDIPVCIEDDWSSSISPETCPQSGEQTKTWTKIGNCEGGVVKESSEIITCTPGIVVCTNWTYSDWGECNAVGKKTRVVILSLPDGCEGGDSVIVEACGVVSSFCTCEGLICGDNSCGENCGSCQIGDVCVKGDCVEINESIVSVNESNNLSVSGAGDSVEDDGEDAGSEEDDSSADDSEDEEDSDGSRWKKGSKDDSSSEEEIPVKSESFISKLNVFKNDKGEWSLIRIIIVVVMLIVLVVIFYFFMKSKEGSGEESSEMVSVQGKRDVYNKQRVPRNIRRPGSRVRRRV